MYSFISDDARCIDNRCDIVDLDTNSDGPAASTPTASFAGDAVLSSVCSGDRYPAREHGPNGDLLHGG